MRIIRHYLPTLVPQQHTITIEGDSAHYIGKVLRAKVEQVCHFFNGTDQYEYAYKLTTIAKHRLSFSYMNQIPAIPSLPIQINIAQALGKGDKLELVIQKGTELGASAITPIVSQRVDFKIPRERQSKRIESWQKIAISASEQCGRVDIPHIAEITDIKNFITQDKAELKLILSPYSEHTLSTISTQNPRSITMLIGPEGGLTDEEVAFAIEHGYTSIKLGPRILRTETAPIALCSIINHLWGDF